jgi:Tfp pilus assembly protein FimT
MVVLMTLAIPAYNAISGSVDFTSEVYNMAGTLDQARAYAMANDTYVLVGIIEVSAAQSASANPQSGATGGRIEMAAIASKSGSRPYGGLFGSTNSLDSWSTTVYDSTGFTSFVAVTPLMTFQNIHLVDLQSGFNTTASTMGGMTRPAVTIPYYNVSNPLGTSNTQFAWPLGSKLNSSPQYTFAKVIEFDPEGSSRISSIANPAFSSFPDAIPQYIEMGLQPAHGTNVPAKPTQQNQGQLAAIQINGISGAIHMYRP